MNSGIDKDQYKKRERKIDIIGKLLRYGWIRRRCAMIKQKEGITILITLYVPLVQASKDIEEGIKREHSVSNNQVTQYSLTK